MNTTGKPIPASGGVLGQYVASVKALHGALQRISDNKYEIAASLSRAAAALRSVAEPLPGSRQGFGTETQSNSSAAATCRPSEARML